jgi:hypothetical protein
MKLGCTRRLQEAAILVWERPPQHRRQKQPLRFEVLHVREGLHEWLAKPVLGVSEDLGVALDGVGGSPCVGEHLHGSP